jgi:iron complex outermembrane recepter protein
MKTWLLYLSCFLCFQAGAQVRGCVTDENNKPLPGATISITRPGDSTKLKTTVTDSRGYFVLEQQSGVVIRISFTGYEPRTLALKDGDMGLIALVPRSSVLGEVVIVRKQPLVQQLTDRTLVHITPDVLKLAGNALELIRLAPGLLISDNEDAISVSGKEAVAVMINGKLLRLSTRDLVKLLKSMPSSSLSQLEVMTNPPARYDIPGNTALLNFRTNTAALRGFKGNAEASSAQGGHNWGDLSGILNYGTGTLAVSSYLAYHYGGYQTWSSKEAAVGTGMLSQQNTSLDKWRDPVGRLTIDYALNARHTIGGVAEWEASRNSGSYQTQSILNKQETNTEAQNPNTRRWNTYNLNYRFADTSGSELNVDLDRSDYTKNDESWIRDAPEMRNTIGYLTLNKILFTTLKIDFTRAWTTKMKVEAGAKLSMVRAGNKFSRTGSADLHEFIYNEKVRSAYANLGGDYARWGWRFGLRVEQSNVGSRAIAALGNKIQRPDSAYLNVLPFLYLSHRLSAKHHLRFSATERIKRPDYADLQPFTYQVDPFNFRYGNPMLRLQRDRNAELTYTYQDRTMLTTSYTRTTDIVNPVFFRSGTSTYQTVENTGARDTWNLNLTYPVNVNPWWNMVNKLNGSYNHFRGRLYQGLLDSGSWAYQLSATQRFSLPDKFKLQLSARYTSSLQNLIYYQGSSANISAAVNRTLFKDQGSIRIFFSDIFRTQRNHVSVDFGDLKYTQLNTWESRRVGLDLTWKFGNGKIRQTKERNTGNSEERGRSGK